MSEVTKLEQDKKLKRQQNIVLAALVAVTVLAVVVCVINYNNGGLGANQSNGVATAETATAETAEADEFNQLVQDGKAIETVAGKLIYKDVSKEYAELEKKYNSYAENGYRNENGYLINNVWDLDNDWRGTLNSYITSLKDMNFDQFNENYRIDTAEFQSRLQAMLLSIGGTLQDYDNEHDAAVGDIATLRFESRVDGTEVYYISGGYAEYELGTDALLSGLDDQVVGHKKGYQFTFDVVADEGTKLETVSGDTIDASGKTISTKAEIVQLQYPRTAEVTNDEIKNYMEALGVSGVTDRAGLEEYIKKSWAAETLWLDLDSTTMWNTRFNSDNDMSEAMAKHLSLVAAAQPEGYDKNGPVYTELNKCINQENYNTLYNMLPDEYKIDLTDDQAILTVYNKNRIQIDEIKDPGVLKYNCSSEYEYQALAKKACVLNYFLNTLDTSMMDHNYQDNSAAESDAADEEIVEGSNSDEVTSEAVESEVVDSSESSESDEVVAESSESSGVSSDIGEDSNEVASESQVADSSENSETVNG